MAAMDTTSGLAAMMTQSVYQQSSVGRDLVSSGQKLFTQATHQSEQANFKFKLGAFLARFKHGQSVWGGKDHAAALTSLASARANSRQSLAGSSLDVRMHRKHLHQSSPPHLNHREQLTATENSNSSRTKENIKTLQALNEKYKQLLARYEEKASVQETKQSASKEDLAELSTIEQEMTRILAELSHVFSTLAGENLAAVSTLAGKAAAGAMTQHANPSLVPETLPILVSGKENGNSANPTLSAARLAELWEFTEQTQKLMAMLAHKNSSGGNVTAEDFLQQLKNFSQELSQLLAKHEQALARSQHASTPISAAENATFSQIEQARGETERLFAQNKPASPTLATANKDTATAPQPSAATPQQANQHLNSEQGFKQGSTGGNPHSNYLFSQKYLQGMLGKVDDNYIANHSTKDLASVGTGLAGGGVRNVDRGWHSYSAPVTARLNPSVLLDKVVGGVKTAVSGGREIFTLTLKPENLGAVSVLMKKANDQLTVRLIVETHTVKTMLDDQLADIKLQLARENIDVTDLAVDIAQRDSTAHYANEQTAAHLWEKWTTKGVPTQKVGAELTSDEKISSYALNDHWQELSLII